MSAGTHLFWITSRAAGIAALVLSSAAVAVGLFLALGGGRERRPELRALHEMLSLCTLTAIAVHGVSLLFDHFFHPGIAGIAIPFAGTYRPLWTGIGIIGGYGLAALGLTYYVRERLGPNGWRQAHRFTALFWILGIAHSIGAGTDGRTLWFLAVAALAVAPGAGLLLARLGRSGAASLDLPRSASPMRTSDGPGG